MTLCNMSIEGAARCGYVNPDQTTVEYIKGRLFAPTGADLSLIHISQGRKCSCWNGRPEKKPLSARA